MKSIFEYTIGKKAEDTTSAIIHYLIDKQGDAGNAILKYLEISDDCKNVIGSEQEINESGRFDLYFEVISSNQFFIVENKLDANFTWSKNGRHQVDRYLKFIRKNKNRSGQLIILCPAKRSSKIIEEVKSYKREDDDIVFKTWEGLCQTISKFDCYISKELYKFINNWYLVDVEFNKGEKSMLNKEFASSFIKIMQIINGISEKNFEITIIEKPKYDKYLYSYGFYFDYQNSSYWFGFYPEIMASTGKMLVLKNETLCRQNKDFKRIKNENNEEFDGFYYLIENVDTLTEINDELMDLLTT